VEDAAEARLRRAAELDDEGHDRSGNAPPFRVAAAWYRPGMARKSRSKEMSQRAYKAVSKKSESLAVRVTPSEQDCLEVAFPRLSGSDRLRVLIRDAIEYKAQAEDLCRRWTAAQERALSSAPTGLRAGATCAPAEPAAGSSRTADGLDSAAGAAAGSAEGAASIDAWGEANRYAAILAQEYRVRLFELAERIEALAQPDAGGQSE
jgi:hypothetical protein